MWISLLWYCCKVYADVNQPNALGFTDLRRMCRSVPRRWRIKPAILHPQRWRTHSLWRSGICPRRWHTETKTKPNFDHWALECDKKRPCSEVSNLLWETTLKEYVSAFMQYLKINKVCFISREISLLNTTSAPLSSKTFLTLTLLFM